MMLLSFLTVIILISATNAYANPACAVCTVAVGASLEIARSLGVDDCVVGIWAGALLALLGYWLMGRNALLMIISVGSIGFMYISEITYSPRVIWHVFYLDPLLFSTILGALVFIYASKFYQWMKKNNGGHAHFPFEKVVVPVVALALFSAYFYYNPMTSGANPAASTEALLENF